MESTNTHHVIELAEAHAEQFRHGFVDWLKLNTPIYLYFEFHALRIARTGRKHYSARTIVEYMRHETHLQEAGGEFKINDHITPDLARFFAIRKPAHADLFSFRVTKVHASLLASVERARHNANMHRGVAA